MHSLLKRQLKKSGIADGESPSPAAWLSLLERIAQSYTEADQERYLLERSLSISSREMQELSGRLQAERDRLSAVLGSVGDGLCEIDASGLVVFINPEGARLLGWRTDELVGRDLLETVGAAEEAEDLDALLGDNSAYRNDDGTFYRRDGSALPVSYVLTPLTSNGRLSGAVLMFHDITQRKRALETKTQLVRRESLLRLARRFASESDAEKVLTDLLDEAVAVLGCEHGILSHWEAAQSVLVPVRSTAHRAASEEAVIPSGSGASGQAIQRRAPVILNDSAGAAVAVPLLHEGRLLGALAVYSYDPDRRFSDEDAEVLELLSGIGSAVLASLERTAELAQANLELQQARDEAHHQALHDGLTGLPNRTLLNDRLEHAILLAERDSSGLALLMMDLDRFKDVNDTLGHQAGDDLLQQVGARLRQTLRASDTVARMGGDEFAVVLPAARDTEVAKSVAQAIVRALEEPFVVGDRPVSIGVSIGIAVSPDHGTDARTLLRRGDVAMYAAKRSGGGYAVYSCEHDASDPERLTTVAELREAIDRDQLVLHYQPKLNLSTGDCARVEALVRWIHPQRGVIPPDQFIPLAEQTGLIKALTRWVLEAAVRQCRQWRDAGLELGVAVNLSMRNLHDPDLLSHVADVLARWNVDPSWLWVEVTESAIMTDPRRALETLGGLRAMGVEALIDDFGTGHSSLSYLKHLPVAGIKLDRSFVRDMQFNENDFAIVRATVELAHQLGLRVVAEGVEDRPTLDLLVAMGCDSAQGYYMSRPLRADDLERWFDRRDATAALQTAA